MSTPAKHKRSDSDDDKVNSKKAKTVKDDKDDKDDKGDKGDKEEDDSDLSDLSDAGSDGSGSDSGSGSGSGSGSNSDSAGSSSSSGSESEDEEHDEKNPKPKQDKKDEAKVWTAHVLTHGGNTADIFYAVTKAEATQLLKMDWSTLEFEGGCCGQSKCAICSDFVEGAKLVQIHQFKPSIQNQGSFADKIWGIIQDALSKKTKTKTKTK
jgi:hypothetical protein